MKNKTNETTIFGRTQCPNCGQMGVPMNPSTSEAIISVTCERCGRRVKK